MYLQSNLRENHVRVECFHLFIVMISDFLFILAPIFFLFLIDSKKCCDYENLKVLWQFGVFISI